MHILVTGHEGYIGAVTVPMFQGEGYEAVGFDDDLFDGCVFSDQSICGGE